MAAILKIENKVVNTKCPISGRDVDPGKTADYKGDKVGFCCGNCLKKFTASPDTFAGKIENAGQPFNDTCLMKNKPAKASLVVKFEKTVAFCCGNCKKKFDGNPAAFAGKLQ